MILFGFTITLMGVTTTVSVDDDDRRRHNEE